MATTEFNRNGDFSFLKFFVVCFFLLLVFSLGYVLITSHAVEKHGVTEVEIVRQCLNNFGPSMRFEKTHTITGKKRTGLVCQLSDGNFGIQILEEGDEVTAFIRRRLDGLKSNPKEILEYMKSKSWRLIK